MDTDDMDVDEDSECELLGWRKSQQQIAKHTAYYEDCL